MLLVACRCELTPLVTSPAACNAASASYNIAASVLGSDSAVLLACASIMALLLLHLLVCAPAVISAPNAAANRACCALARPLAGTAGRCRWMTRSRWT